MDIQMKSGHLIIYRLKCSSQSLFQFTAESDASGLSEEGQQIDGFSSWHHLGCHHRWESWEVGSVKILYVNQKAGSVQNMTVPLLLNFLNETLMFSVLLGQKKKIKRNNCYIKNNRREVHEPKLPLLLDRNGPGAGLPQASL